MKVRVNLWGILAEVAGKSYISLSEISNLEQFTTEINQRYPAFKDLNYRISLNGVIKSGNKKLKESDVIDMVPPYAGG